MVILFNQDKKSISAVRLVDKTLISIKPFGNVTLNADRIKNIILPEGVLTLADNAELKLVTDKINGIISESKPEETKVESKPEETKVESKPEETKPIVKKRGRKKAAPTQEEA